MSRPTPLSYGPQRADFETDVGKLSGSYNKGRDVPHGPVTSTDMSGPSDTAWAQFFGIPSKSVAKDPYQFYPRENYDLPEAYRGNNLYLDLLIIYQIRLSQMVAITRLLPLKRWDRSMRISWDVWKFNDARLGRTPEEGVSRLVTSTFDQGSATFQRWGLAFMLEHGFMNTNRGRMNYRMNLLQIANATIETLCHGVIIALLSCANMTFLTTQKPGGVTTDEQRWSMFKEEIDQWACAHHKEAPFVYLWDKLRAKIRTMTGEEADILYVPYGSRNSTNRPEDAYFFLSGRPRDYNSGTQMPGAAIVESRDHKTAEGKDEDPIWQPRSIGSHTHMLDKHFKNIDPLKWKTSMMNIRVYDEANDQFMPIDYSDAVLKTGMFKHNLQTDTWDMTELGAAFFSENTTWGDYLASVGRLDTWAKQLTQGNHERLLEFINKFSGIEPEKDDDDDSFDDDGDEDGKDGGSGKKKKAQKPPKDLYARRGPFFQEPQDAVDHQDALGDVLTRPAGALTPAGAKLLRAIFDLVRKQNNRGGVPAPQAQDFINPSAGGMGLNPPAAEIKDYSAASSSSSAPVADLATVLANAVTVYGAALAYSINGDQYGITDGRTMFSIRAANLLLGYAIRSRDAAVISQVVAAVKKIINGSANDNLIMNGLQEIFTAMKALPAYAGGHTATYAFNFIQDTTPLAKQMMRASLSAAEGHVAWTDAAPSGSDPVSLFQELYNATFEFLHDSSKAARLTAAATKAAANWAALKPQLQAISQLRPLQVAVPGLAGVLLRLGDKPNAKQIEGACKKFNQVVLGEIGKLITEQNGPADQGGLSIAISATPAVDLAARFHVDQVAEEQGRDPSDTEPPFDGRDFKNHTRLYERFPVIRQLLGDENLYLLYHRMVLAKERPDHKTISRQHFIYYLSLLDTLYADDLDLANDQPTASVRSRAKRNAELRVILLLQESAYQRAFKLRELLQIDAHEKLWDEGLGVESFLRLCNNAPYRLQDRIRTTQNALVQAVRAESDEFITEWHKKLPKDIRDELLRVGVNKLAKAQGHSIALLNQAIIDVKAMKDPVPQGQKSKGAAMDKEGKVSKEMIKDLLQNMQIVDGELVRWGLDNDMWPIIGIFLLKPHGTWVMGQCFAMLGGGRVGNTFEGHHDFQLQDNAIRKMHYGHWTLWAKSVVIRAEGIAHAFNIVAHQYLGGNNNIMWDINNPDHLMDYSQGKVLERGIFPVPVRINRDIPHWAFDITGEFNKFLGGTPEYCKERSLKIWSQAWGWEQDGTNPMTRPIISVDFSPRHQTLVFSGNQYIFDPSTGKTDLFIPGKGHWAEREVDGCGKVRDGRGGYLLPRRNETASVAIIT